MPSQTPSAPCGAFDADSGAAGAVHRGEGGACRAGADLKAFATPDGSAELPRVRWLRAGP
ncbi:hypothetical protein DCW30_33435 [Streptomyces alfalfae]|uniref:Uncharacterized protein n=1 Tax=Streptomyces alfalfae TaxID=1642299 RepID=A0ABN4VSQ4_9ACTN|nr:hypothetical protein A7J05_27190 [Streptomyces alfalfae]AYA19304.1 hypothetical protein D3X13_26370 [Streptomyces fradiae]RXX36130.1 hypothetical protein DCW30_33435 [Streptomyces alfalfae]